MSGKKAIDYCWHLSLYHTGYEWDSIHCLRRHSGEKRGKMEILWMALLLVGVGIIIFLTKKLDGEGKDTKETNGKEKK